MKKSTVTTSKSKKNRSQKPQLSLAKLAERKGFENVSVVHKDKMIEEPRETFSEIDWFRAHRVSLQRFDHLIANEKNKGFISYLWPIGQEYYSPLNPIFLTSNYPIDVLNEHPMWMARDGLVPLLWFFQMNPKPGRFKQKILIHETFSPFVPEAWRNNMGTYRVDSTKTDQISVNKVILTTYISEMFCSQEYLKKLLAQIATTVGEENIRNITKYLFCLDKNLGYGQETKHQIVPEFMRQIYKVFGTEEYQLWNWTNLDAYPNFEGFHYCEISEMLLCADSYVAHHVAKRGARPLLNSRPKEQDEELIELSPYHGVFFKRHLSGEYMLSDKKRELDEAKHCFTKFEAAMRSEANTGLPWPGWITPWTKLATEKAGQ